MKDLALTGLAELLPASDNVLKVNKNLTERLDRLSAEGFVDCKAMCSPDRNSSSSDKLWVLNNVLRQYESGACSIEVIGA